MAAKKAATKSKSRTSSKKGKSTLKWWYILPVIAIIAVAGYAIVRFSEASRVVTTIRPNSWRGSGKVDAKFAGGPQVKYVDNEISYYMGGNTIQNGRVLCINAYVVNVNGNKGAFTMNVDALRPIDSGRRILGQPDNRWASVTRIQGRSESGNRDLITACTPPINEGINSSGVWITVRKLSGVVAVQSVTLYR